MISLIHSPEQFPDSVGQLSDPYLLRIVSSAEAYGLGTPFLDIWQGNGCCFSRMDGVMTVSGTPLPEFLEETALFLRASGAGQLSCSRETAVQLGFAPDSTGPILCRKQAGGVLPLPPSFPSPRQLYEVLKSFYQLSFTKARQILNATVGSSEIYGYLETEQNQPLLRINAASFCLYHDNETVFEIYESYILTDILSYYVEKYNT